MRLRIAYTLPVIKSYLLHDIRRKQHDRALVKVTLKASVVVVVVLFNRMKRIRSSTPTCGSTWYVKFATLRDPPIYNNNIYIIIFH